MIVNKPIGSIKIGNTVSRLTVGKQVPKNVLDYWEKTNQLEELKKVGAISDSGDEKKDEKIEDKKEEKKVSEKFDFGDKKS